MEAHAENTCHSGRPADHSEIAFVDVMKGPAVLVAFEMRKDPSCRIGAALHCHLGHAGQRAAVRPGELGQVAHDIDLGIPRKG